MTVVDQQVLAVLSPMWQRIARGEVDLAQYSDEEILTAQIRMADDRVLPAPKVIPEAFLHEQRRRGFIVAERKVREGAMDALEVYSNILNDRFAEDRDRLKAGEWFLTRFLGKEAQHLRITHEGQDPREALIERLLQVRQGLPEAPDDVIDAEVVEDELADLL